MRQQPPEQTGQPDPVNPQTNAAQPDLVPPIRRPPRQGEGELVPPAQSVRQPVSNLADGQRAPSGNVAPVQPDHLSRQRNGQQAAPGPASVQGTTRAHPDTAANAGTSGGAAAATTAPAVPPAQPVAPPTAGGTGAVSASATDREQASRGREEAGRFVTISSLMHLPVLDLGTGQRLGRVDNIILSSDHRTVEAYTSHGGFLRGTKAFPARGATIGQDAIVLPPGALERFDKRSLRGLPLAGPVTGTRLLSDTGRVLGTITDVRMDPVTAEVVGYEVDPEDKSLLDRLRRRAAVLPVTAVRRRGTDAWIVAEDDARRHL